MAQVIQASFPAKLECLFLPKRTKVLYGGRGSAKSWSIARALILKSVNEGIRVLCVREQQNSIAESVYKLLCDQINALGYSSIFEIQRDKITCKKTGASFFFEGIKANVQRIKSYEGIDICWAEEAHNISKESWEVLIPTIRKPGSEIWISFNPNLESDYTYQEFVLKDDPDTVKINLSWRDNPWFPEVLMKEMEKLKLRDFTAYLNVWEGQCRTLVSGAVYKEELEKLLARGGLTKVPYQPGVPVDCFWDLGWADLTTVWFRQKVGFEYHYIDYLEGSQKPLAYYVGELQKKGYLYGTMWLPHDAKAKEKGSGKSIEEQLRAFYPVRVVKRLSLVDGIDAVRGHLPLAYIDREKCSQGFKALGAYRYEVVDEAGSLSKVPVHDWSSHAADSFRYSAIATYAAPTEKAERTAERIQRVVEGVFTRSRPGEDSNVGWMK